MTEEVGKLEYCTNSESRHSVGSAVTCTFFQKEQLIFTAPVPALPAHSFGYIYGCVCVYTVVF